MSARSQAQHVRSGKLSARQVVVAHLQRIKVRDSEVGSFLRVFDASAIAEAEALDRQGTVGDPRPLLGVPVAIKDSIPIRGEPTACGTMAQPAPAPADAEIVARLRAAGAIIIGKTALPELAAWPFTLSGKRRTCNPYDLERDPGGSSGGSAAAVASHMCAIAIGDDLGGSIRVPAACTGLVGLKPQRDRVPQTPNAGRVHGLSVYGALTRSVQDAGLALDVLSGAKGFESAALRLPARLRIAISLRAPVPSAPSGDILAAFERFADTLRDLGHDVSYADVPVTRLLIPSFFLRYFRGMHDELKALGTPKVERRIRILAGIGGLIPAWAIRRAFRWQDRVVRDVSRFFEDVDVLLSPVVTQAPMAASHWSGVGFARTMWRISRYSPYAAMWNVAGTPACSVPVGMDPNGLPLAVQIATRKGEEETLLSLANEVLQSNSVNSS